MHVKRLPMIFTIVTPIAILMWLGPASAFQSNVGNAPGTIMKKGIAMDVRAIGRQIADEVAHGADGALAVLGGGGVVGEGAEALGGGGDLVDE